MKVGQLALQELATLLSVTKVRSGGDTCLDRPVTVEGTEGLNGCVIIIGKTLVNFVAFIVHIAGRLLLGFIILDPRASLICDSDLLRRRHLLLTGSRRVTIPRNNILLGNVKLFVEIELALIVEHLLHIDRLADRRIQIAVENVGIFDEDHVLLINYDTLEAVHLQDVVLLGFVRL